MCKCACNVFFSPIKQITDIVINVKYNFGKTGKLYATSD